MLFLSRGWTKFGWWVGGKQSQMSWEALLLFPNLGYSQFEPPSERVQRGRFKPSHLSLQWSHVPDLLSDIGHGKGRTCYLNRLLN